MTRSIKSLVMLVLGIMACLAFAEQQEPANLPVTTPSPDAKPPTSATLTDPEKCKQMVSSLTDSEFAALSLTFTPIIQRYPDLAVDTPAGNDLRHQMFDELFHNVVYYELHNTKEEESSSSSSSSSHDASAEPAHDTDAPKPDIETAVSQPNGDEKAHDIDQNHIMDTDIAFSFYFVNDLDVKQIVDNFNAHDEDHQGWELIKKSLYTDEELQCRFDAFTQLMYKVKEDTRSSDAKAHIVQRHIVEQELKSLHEQITNLEKFQQELNDKITKDEQSPEPNEAPETHSEETKPAVSPPPAHEEVATPA